MKEVMRCNAYTYLIFTPAKLDMIELKVVLLHLWRVNVKTIGGFISTPLADFFFCAIIKF